MTRIGLVGCGNWGRHILRDLRELGADVSVVFRSDDSVGRARAGGAVSIHSSVTQLPDVDGYVVATPSATHASIIEQLIPTGRKIFVEKPMTTDLESAKRFMAVAGERIAVMDKWRHHPGIEAMRQQIVAGRVGDICAILLNRWSWSNPHNDASALWHLVPHDLSITQHLVGRLPALSNVLPVDPRRPELGALIQLAGPAQPSPRSLCPSE